MVAIRSTGYSFDAIIGYKDNVGDNIAFVDEAYLRVLVGIANDRFRVNAERIARFQSSLLAHFCDSSAASSALAGKDAQWEDTNTRRQRKREEGLARQRALMAQSMMSPKQTPSETTDSDALEAVFG
jgi:tRNA wybutosine-synthesizing protein 3